MGSHDGQGLTTMDPRQRARGGKMHHTRVDTAATDVNSAVLQGFERSSAGIEDFSSDLSSVFAHEESAKIENAAMELSLVPEALMTFHAARDKMKGKSEGQGEPGASFSGKGKGKWRKLSSDNNLQHRLAARKAKSTCHECGQRGQWADLGC